MKNTVRCDGCNVELEIDKIAFQEYDEQNTAWYYCEECKKYLNTNEDKPFVAPKEKEEIIECDYCGIGLPKSKAIFYKLDEENLACHYCKICSDSLQKHVKFVERSIENAEQNLENEEQVREFNEVIIYFKELMERHGIVAKIISDNIDHKSFMDELNYRINSRSFSCIMILNNRIWISTSSDDIVKLLLIDDRTTKKDLTTEVKARIFEVFQESEIATMKKKHKKELDLLKGTYEAGPTTQVPNPYRKRR